MAFWAQHDISFLADIITTWSCRHYSRILYLFLILWSVFPPCQGCCSFGRELAGCGYWPVLRQWLVCRDTSLQSYQYGGKCCLNDLFPPNSSTLTPMEKSVVPKSSPGGAVLTSAPYRNQWHAFPIMTPMLLDNINYLIWNIWSEFKCHRWCSITITHHVCHFSAWSWRDSDDPCSVCMCHCVMALAITHSGSVAQQDTCWIFSSLHRRQRWKKGFVEFPQYFVKWWHERESPGSG